MGLQKILQLLESDDANIRIHAVKVVANLAAEGKFCSLPDIYASILFAIGSHSFPIFVGFDKQRQIRKRLLKLEVLRHC